MARSIARQILTVGAAALLPLTAGAVAHAAPDSGVSDQAPLLPVQFVQAIQHDLKLSPAEYLQRSEVAQQLAKFATIAEQLYPDVFAGSWLDQDGQPIIGLAPGAQTAAARAEITANGFAVKDVAKSSATLRNEKSTLSDWFADQPAPIASLVRGIAIDTINNTLAVQVTELPGGLRLPSFVDPAHVVVIPSLSAPQPVPVPRTNAAAIPPGALAGGDGYIAATDQAAARCSLGFNGTDSRGQAVNITAGHCNPDLASAGTATAAGMYELLEYDRGGARLGTFVRSRLDGHDWSIVAITPAAQARFANNGVRVPGAAPLAIDGTAQPVVGAPVCKSGSRTGFSCGTVLAVDQDIAVGDHRLTGSFASSICALPGDSGGAVVTGTRALGVSSASSVADYPICEIPNLLGMLTGDGPLLFSTPINTILADNPGLRVRTS